MKIGFTCGVFDLFHAGHVLMLEEARKACDYLVVGIRTDPTSDREHKSKPVQSIVERQIQVSACRYVDEIIIYETEKELEEILSTIDMDIRILGSDYKTSAITGRKICATRGIELYYNERNHSYSSTNLKERVKNGS